MLQLLQDFYLVSHDFDVLLLFAFFLDGLDSHELSSEFATCLVNMAISPLSDERDYVVIFLLVLGHIIQIILFHEPIRPTLDPSYEYTQNKQ